MKVLLDHNLDRRLKNSLSDFEAATTQEMGWAALTNGELLGAAEQSGFNVMLTADANIKSQQNLSGRTIAVLVLRAPNNRLTTHLKMLNKLHSALDAIKDGEIVEVFYQQ